MRYYEAKQIREKRQTEVLEKHGVFFAFSKKQFEERQKPNVKYVSLGGGMVVPKNSIDDFIKDNEDLQADFEQLVHNHCDPIEVIRYELGNHEYCITYDLTDTKEALEEFNFTDEQYSKAIELYFATCSD